MKNRIKELREQKRISQVCLATHIGCSQNTISKMELEMSEPKASQLLEMAKYFNVSVDYILCNSDYKYIQEVYHNAKNIEVENIDFIKMYKNLSESDKELIYAFCHLYRKHQEWHRAACRSQQRLW